MKIDQTDYLISVEHDSSQDTIRLKLQNNSLSKASNWGGPFSIASPVEVDNTIEKIKNFLSAYSIASHDVDSITKRIDEFKYISRVSCDALHFSLEKNIELDESRIRSLLGEIVKIASFSREEMTPSRSLLIDTFNINDEDKVQLRMVLDQDGNFLSFSFARENESMTGYTWYTKGHAVYLKDRRGDVVLSVDLENFKRSRNQENESGLILVKSRKENSIENESRSYIRLTHNENNEWEMDRYNTQHFSGNISKNGVPLSSSFAEHTPILQLHGSDVYFPKLDVDALLSRFEKDTFSAISFRETEDSYNECMGERTSLGQEQIHFGHSDLSLVESDNIIFCERLGLLNQKDYRDNLTYRSCLLNAGVLVTQEYFEYLNFDNISKITDSEFEEKINNCKSQKEFVEAKSLILSLDEFSDLNLTGSQRSEFESALDDCFVEFGQEKCVDMSKEIIETKTMLSFLSGIAQDKVSCFEEIRFTEDGGEHKVDCYNDSISKALETYDEEFIREGFHSLGESLSREIELTSTQEAVLSFKSCFKAELTNETSYYNQKDKWYQFEQFCLTQALKESVKEELVGHANEKVYELLGWLDDEGLDSSVKASILLEIEEELKDWSDISSYKELKDSVASKVYSTIASHFLMKRVADIDNKEFDDVLKSFLLSSDHSDSSIMPSLRLSLRSIEGRVSSKLSELAGKDRSTYIKNLMKTAELTRANIKNVEDVDNTTSHSLALLRTHSERISCIDDVSVAPNINFSQEMKECLLNGHAEIVLEESRIDFENLISASFLVESAATGRLLNTVSELKNCLEKFSTIEYFPNEKYKSLMNGCYVFAKFQLNQGLGQEKLLSYRPIVSGEELESYQGCSFEIIKELGSDIFSNESVVLSSSISLEEISSLDSKNVRDHFLQEVSTKEEDLGGQLLECDAAMEITIISGVKNYFIDKIPSLSALAEDDRNRSVLTNFFDEELIGLVLKFHKINDLKDSDAAIDLGTLVSEERVLTGQLGISSLTNFLDSLGSYFDKGFIYDESQMRTELVVFKSELKDFLRWYNTNPNDVTIREAKDFFSQSELGEHLAMAVVSEVVYTKFTTGINHMRAQEIRDFFRATQCKTYYSCFEKRSRNGNAQLKREYEAIIEKYDSLLVLTKTMTSSYDFRRIIRPETDQGEEIIAKAFDSILAPEILGTSSNAQRQEELMDALGEAILADNTDGGFSERFVEEVAKHALEQEESSRNGISKWLFYDEGDFDWDVLRQTESGKEALNYYTRFIMLPKMLGQSESRYLRNLRQTQFEKLMRQAQDENEH